MRTNDSRAVNNTLLFSRFTLPARADLTSGGFNVWLMEPLTDAQEVGVGVTVNVSGGSMTALAEWGSWESDGSSAVVVNGSLAVSPGGTVLLSIADVGGGEWSLTVNGRAVPSGSGGRLPLGVAVADDVSSEGALQLPEPVPALVTNSTGPFPLTVLSWSEAFALASASSPILPGDGYVESAGETWGVQGEDQQVRTEPDAFNESAALPVLPNGTYVWGIGNTNFPPAAAWTTSDPNAFAAPGAALELTVPRAPPAPGNSTGLCQELLDPLDNGRWLTVGVCWDDGIGVRAYAAVTRADGAAYQKTMYASLPVAGQTALIAVRAVGQGVWQAYLNGQVMEDASGNRSLVGGGDLGNASMGPYGALRGYPDTPLPSVVTLPEGILVYRNLTGSTPYVPSGGLIADSDTRSPALVDGHLENASLPSGTIQVLPGRPSLPFGTPLWNSTELASSGTSPSGGFAYSLLVLAILAPPITVGAAALYGRLPEAERGKRPWGKRSLAPPGRTARRRADRRRESTHDRYKRP